MVTKPTGWEESTPCSATGRMRFDWLKRTVALGDVNYPWFERDKNYDSLRSDPEYQSIMAGVRQRWEAYKKEFDAAP